jgi:hypothetical protein
MRSFAQAFGDFAKGMYTMFSITTMDGWQELVVMPMIVVLDHHCCVTCCMLLMSNALDALTSRLRICIDLEPLVIMEYDFTFGYEPCKI